MDIPSQKFSILLVEDNVLNQKLIVLNLNRLGYTIDIANNGAEALEMVKTKFYSLILMDLMMPVMDGLEASIKIREYQSDKLQRSVIIGLTANTFDGDREKCLNSGMDEYMPKPFDLNEFNFLVEKLNLNS